MLDKILEKFSGSIKKGENSYMVLCPLHDDKNPSLSISLGRNGVPVLYCHACKVGGDTILNPVGLALKDFYPNVEPKVKSWIVAEYDYRDEAGNRLYQAVRLEPKKFYQRRPVGDGWQNNLNGTRRVLYRLPELLKADKAFPVFIVEGEKDVENLLSIGVVATCNPQGAGKWKDEYNEFLKDRRCVICRTMRRCRNETRRSCCNESFEDGRRGKHSAFDGLAGQRRRVGLDSQRKHVRRPLRPSQRSRHS